MSSTQNSQSNSQSQSQSNSASGSRSSTVSIPQSAPAGILSVTQPPQASTSFFKLAPSETINFQWSFSGVLATPTSLTVQAIGANSFTYMIGSVPGTSTSINWVPYDYQQSNPGTPLAPTTYTLAIYDERGLTATMRQGFLSPNTALKFALYTPQPYTPIASGWTCIECNAATSNLSQQQPVFVATIATLIVVFLSGFGLLRNFYAYQRR